MTLIPIETNWSTELESCERLLIDINFQIEQRNKHFPTSEKYQNISTSIRMRLMQFNAEVKELKRKLQENTLDITTAELERRSRQIEILESKYIQITNQLGKDEEKTSMENQDRTDLLGPSGSVWKNNEDDDDIITSDGNDREALLKKSSIQKMREQNARVLREQDEGLESLSKIISRQKDIATRIYDEVENQSELLDGISSEMENVDVRLETGTRQITQVVRKPSLCGYYLLVLVLILILVLVIWLK